MFEKDSKNKDASLSSLNELVAEINFDINKALDSQNIIQPEIKSKENKQYIKFNVKDIGLAIPISNILEIGHLPDITPLPNLPGWILGISNIRGEIVSMIDLKLFWEISSKGLKKDQRFIICYNQDIKAGFIVDGVQGMFSVDATRDKIQPPPYKENNISQFLSGVILHNGKIINIIDINKLLYSKRMNAFKTKAL